MFIRFSNRDEITVYEDKVDNSAGFQRLADGSKIVGAVKR
ncbi:MAG: hypothetical protein CM15mV60_310 [uncultured marine virus]|nr:MAG: hypothetical protein CM15mV60_310 [uncultured marine virus]